MQLSNPYKELMELNNCNDNDQTDNDYADNNCNSKDNDNNETSSYHLTEQTWSVWAHLPHDSDWSLHSYKYIYNICSIEETITITELLPDILVKNCMLFIMKDGILPMWEDACNKNGGCFSYKVSNKNVYEVWRDLTYCLVGNTISPNEQFGSSVTGITISPKKNFCIIKIWMTNCSFQNAMLVTQEVKGLSSHGCIFKKHAPEL